MANDVKLKIGGDVSELLSAVKNAMGQIQREAEKLKISPGVSRATPGAESVREASQTNRALNQRLREEKAGAELINRELSRKKILIDEIAKAKAAEVKGSERELELTRQLNREKERFRQTEKIAQIQQESYRKAQEAQRRATGGAGGNALERFAGSMGSKFVTGGIGTVGGIIGGLAQAGLTANSLYRYFGQAPIETIGNVGSATQGTFGRELEAVYSGRSAIENAYLPEKARAAQMAVEANRRAEATQFTDAGLSLAKRGGLGMAGGAAAGAIAGSFIPGIGTAIGAGVGGALGAFGGAGSMLGDQSQRNVLLSPFSQTADKARQAELAKSFADNFNKALEGERSANPLKRLVTEQYNQDYLRNLEFQRSVGLNYDTFHGGGGFRERTINAGFTDQMGMGMASSILGAGGSSAGARDLSVLGLQMQRGMNVTNAGNIIGQLTGAIGSTGTTKDATVKLLQEGVSLGFDSSKYAEENRRFLEVGAQAIAKSGTTSAAGAADVLDTLSRFFGADKTIQGIQAGANAYQKYQEISTASTGPRGVLRAAGFLTSSTFGQLSPQDRMAISSIPDNELTPDDPRILAISRKTGKSPEDIISERKRIDANAVYRTSYAQRASDTYQKYKSNQFVVSPNAMREAQENAVLAAQSEFSGMPRRELQALVEGASGGARRTGTGADVASLLAGRETGKIEDRSVQGQAESSRIMLENFQKMSQQIVPTAEAIANFNKQLQATVDIVMKMPEAERGGVFSKLFPNLYGPQNQTQTGRAGGK